MIRLSKEQVILLHEQLIAETGGAAGLAREEMLESALNAPFQTIGGLTLIRLCSKRQRACVAGQSRTIPLQTETSGLARTLCQSFLSLNGIELHYEQDELSDVILMLAAGEIGQAELLRWVLEHQA